MNKLAACNRGVRRLGMKRLLLFAGVVGGAVFWLGSASGLINVSWQGESTATESALNSAVPVIDAEVRYRDIPVKLEAVGTIQAMNSVTVRSQVDGRLLELSVKEGSTIQRGDLVARIDAATYRASYDQAVAKKSQDEATLANAKIDLDRYITLSERGAGTRQQTDTQRAQVAQLTALVQADQAAIENAKAVLDYTMIRSPIDGLVGIRLVDVGNLIRTSDASGIVTIAQIQPIFAIFNLPQQQFRSVKDAFSRGEVKVQAVDADGVTVLAEGVVEVIDNQVDQATGTVKIRARFANDDLALWPGQFANVRVFTDLLKQVICIPSVAVQRGPDGPFVYRVNEESKAVMTPVVIVRQDNEAAVVASSVKPPERVVVSGFQRLADQTRVQGGHPEHIHQPSKSTSADHNEPIGPFLHAQQRFVQGPLGSPDRLRWRRLSDVCQFVSRQAEFRNLVRSVIPTRDDFLLPLHSPTGRNDIAGVRRAPLRRSRISPIARVCPASGRFSGHRDCDASSRRQSGHCRIDYHGTARARVGTHTRTR